MPGSAQITASLDSAFIKDAITASGFIGVSDDVARAVKSFIFAPHAEAARTRPLFLFSAPSRDFDNSAKASFASETIPTSVL